MVLRPGKVKRREKNGEELYEVYMYILLFLRAKSITVGHRQFSCKDFMQRSDVTQTIHINNVWKHLKRLRKKIWVTV